MKNLVKFKSALGFALIFVFSLLICGKITRVNAQNNKEELQSFYDDVWVDDQIIPYSGDVKKIRVGYFYDEVFHQGQTDDEFKNGYGYEYYQMIANYTGWEYEYVYGNWQEIYSKFLAGDIDIIDHMSINSERKNLMLFSNLPMGEERYLLFVPQEGKNIILSDIDNLNGKKIGVIAGGVDQIVLEKFIEDNGLEANIVFCTGPDDRIEKLLSGKIDGMVTTDSFSLEGISPTVKIGYADYYFAVNKLRPDLLDELNVALMKILEQNPNYNTQLKEKYQKNRATKGKINNAEKEWLNAHPVIKVGYRRTTMPLSDQNPETGEVMGLLKDVIDEFSKKLGVTFEAICYEDNNTLVKDLKDGVIDCVFPVIDNVWLSEQLGYRQTFRITEEKMTLLYAGDYKGIDNYKKYGYVVGSPAQYFYILEHNLATETVEYNDVMELLRAVGDKKIECTVLNLSGWNYLNKTNDELSKLNSANFDDPIGYSFAVNRDNLVLLSILENGINQLEDNMILESLHRSTQMPADYSFESFIKHNLGTTFLIVFVIVIVIICIVVYYIKNRINKQYLSYNSEHDALTGVYNRNAFNRFIEEISVRAHICIAMVDIDLFKGINDNYGHEVGDQIIKKVADELTGVVRSEDKVVRFGGDEFILLLYGMNIDNKNVIIRKIDRVIENLKNTDDGLPPVSISVGAAFSEKGYNKEVFENADSALYTRKENGRSGCTVCEKVVK